MTFPAIVEATQSPISGCIALAVGLTAAWLGADLFKTAVLCCAAVLAAEMFLL